MSDDPRPRSRVGVLVLRVWRESAEPGGLRVHIRTVADIEVGEEEVFACASAPEALDVVRRWVEQQAAESTQPP